MSSPVQTETFQPPAAVRAWQRRVTGFAVPFAIVAVAAWVLNYIRPEGNEFYHAYLLGYMWILGLSLGSLALLMVYHTSGGAWGTVIRRILEAAAGTMPAVAIAFVPLLIGLRRIYPWSRPEVVAAHEELHYLAAHYLNVPLFVTRAVLYFVAWVALAYWFRRVSDRQDREHLIADVGLRRVSAAGLVIYVLTLTFAVVDWVMSISAPWVSTIYGLLYVAGHALIGLSFAVIVLAALTRHAPMKSLVKPDQFLDHGKLLLAFTMLWGWFTLSQWLIIWAGNLPEEIAWYRDRTSPGWHAVATLVVLGQFFIPFFILLSRSFKADGRKLAGLALFIIFMRYWDLFWYIVPSFPKYKGHFSFDWEYAVVPLALLSGWMVLFLRNLASRPLLALQDDHVKLLVEAAHEYQHERA